VLEIGCGSGYYLVPLAERLSRASFYGVDVTDAMLASAKGKLNRQALWSSYQLFSEGESIRRLMVFKRKLYERFGRGKISLSFSSGSVFFRRHKASSLLSSVQLLGLQREPTLNNP
jgi:SAM-dependent methyltransferase